MGVIGDDLGVAITIELLDGFRLYRGRELVPVSTSCQRVLAFLTVHSRPVRRLYVASKLWLETSDARAMANLRSVLWRLRSDGLDLISTDRTTVGLVDHVKTDLSSALICANQILSDGPATDTDIAPFIVDLLPDWYEEWLVFERDRYRQLRLHVLETLCNRYVYDGAFGRAIEAGLAAVETEPLAENAQVTLIKAYLAEGNRARAIRQFQAFSKLLRDEMGLEPTDGLTRLVTEDRSHSSDIFEYARRPEV